MHSDFAFTLGTGTKSLVCQVCNGTGEVKLYRHRLSNRSFGGNKPAGYKRYTCPACLGTRTPVK